MVAESYSVSGRVRSRGPLPTKQIAAWAKMIAEDVAQARRGHFIGLDTKVSEFLTTPDGRRALVFLVYALMDLGEIDAVELHEYGIHLNSVQFNRRTPARDLTESAERTSPPLF